MGIINNDSFESNNGVQKSGTYISFNNETLYLRKTNSYVPVSTPAPASVAVAVAVAAPAPVPASAPADLSGESSMSGASGASSVSDPSGPTGSSAPADLSGESGASGASAPIVPVPVVPIVPVVPKKEALYQVNANYRIFWDKATKDSGKSFMELRSVSTQVPESELESNLYSKLYDELKKQYANSVDE